MRRFTIALLATATFLVGIWFARLTTTLTPSAPTTADTSTTNKNLVANPTGTVTPLSAGSPTAGTADGAALGAATSTATPKPTETIPPNTPLATLTPSRTLRPPPTFEPPTQTSPPTLTPSVTPTQPLNLDVTIPGLYGAETATPTSTAGCVPRKDWKLTYTVQRDDALSKIADLYNTTVDELVKGNCLKDKNLIVIGQVLRVPGKVQPVQPAVPCVPFELITPMNGTLNVAGGGNLTFDWRGPRAPRNLIRIWKPDGSKFEDVIELRQNDTIDIGKNLPDAGTYTWYVYPLDSNFVQVCPEGGPWTFTKGQAPTATPKLGP